MHLKYFLLPSDIRLVEKSECFNNKITLRYNNELYFKFVKLYKLDSSNKLQLLETVNLSDKKNFKYLISKYPQLDARLKKIGVPNDIKPSLLKGNIPKIMGILNITKDSF